MGTDATDVDEQTNAMAIRALVPLLVTFILGTLCLQGFNLVFTQVGEAVRAPGQASLITALPSIVLGIVCFIYGSLGDFVSLKKLVAFGLVTLLIGSLFGFISNYYFIANLWTVIIARVLQTAGEQVAGSAYLVVATKYLKNSLKVIFFGLFTAGYPLSAAIGVFAAGSIGIAIIGSLIGSAALGGASLFGVSGNASSYANLLLICGAVVLLGLVVFLVFRRHIYAANR